MDSFIFAKIVLRALAIYLMAQGIGNIGSLASSIIYFEKLNFPSLAPFLFTAVIPIILGIAVWWKSAGLSAYMIGEDTSSESGVSAKSVQTLAISTLGFITVYLAVPQVISTAYLLFENSGVVVGERVFDVNVVASFINMCAKLILGVLLIVGVNFWVELLRRAREFGLEKKK